MDKTEETLYVAYIFRDRGQKMDTHRLNVRRWENTLHTNVNEKKAGIATLILDKTDIKTKTVKKDKER